MVSPHENWEEDGDGYRNGRTGIYVREMNMMSWDDGEKFDGTVFEVVVYTDMGTVSEKPTGIADFIEPRPAWEFANILTHYFEHTQVGVLAARSYLEYGDDAYDEWRPDSPIEGMSGEEVFKKMVMKHRADDRVWQLIDE